MRSNTFGYCITMRTRIVCIAMTPTEAVEILKNLHWTEAKIAAAVGTSQPNVNRIKKGKTPRYLLGDALVRLATRELAPPSVQKAA